MMSSQRILLFGDQTVDVLGSIQALFRCSKKSIPLKTFLREAADALQTSIASLDLSDQKRFLKFNTLLELAEECGRQAVPDSLPSTVLTCAARLGEMILYAEQDPEVLSLQAPDVQVVGICTGLLPATAAFCAKSVNELLILSREILCVSLRLALEGSRRSDRIESKPGCWAYFVTGLSTEECQNSIDRYHADNDVPTHRHAYISVTSNRFVTVCGPPATLQKLFEVDQLLNSASRLPLPVTTAVHAPHLPIPDLQKIIGDSPILNQKLPPKLQMLSNYTAEPFHADDLRTLLLQVLEDVLQHTLNLSDLQDAILSRLRKGRDVLLRSLGPSPHTQLVQGICKSRGFNVILSEYEEPNASSLLRDGSGSIAIVGMSGRFPGADDIEHFWKNILDGLEHHEKIPSSRFDIEKYFDADEKGKNTTSTPYGCFLKSPGAFDHQLFNISPREALQMDPLQRILLMTTYEALQSAGFARDGPISTGDRRVSSWIGQTTDDWRDINRGHGIDIYYVPAVARAFSAGRLNHYFKWEGPAYSVDSACASSTSAIILACSALIGRECDTAIAGGANIIVSPDAFAGLSRGGMGSKTGGCKTFRNDADGYCRGEGVGVVVLKRLEDAIADNDAIHAVIRGYSRNHSAYATSITHPHHETQQRLYSTILRESSVDAHDISYVEMHGTATQAGDFEEMTSVTNIFAKDRPRDNPLHVGAVKANVGHGEAAAGVTALIKTIMMLKNKTIPPQPGIEKGLNLKFPPLEEINVKIAKTAAALKPAPTGDGKIRILLNSFDAAGGNSSVLLEEAPAPASKTNDPRPYHVVTCSARTSNSLRRNQEQLLSFLTSTTDLELADIAYTSSARRLHDVFRVAYPASTMGHLINQLRADVAANTSPKRTPSTVPFVFLCTGQGSQYAGMGRELFKTSLVFRESIMESERLCQSFGFPSFLHLIEDADTAMEEQSPVEIQLAILALTIALAHLWKSWGIKPDLVVGHSLGEYAALHIAGVLSASDVFYLVGNRAKLLLEKCVAGSHSMLAVAAPLDALRRELGTRWIKSCEIACSNAPNMYVVSGRAASVDSFRIHLQGRGIRCKLLKVPFGFHSDQIEAILPDLERLAQRVNFAPPCMPVASTLLGTVVRDPGVFNPAYLVRQSREEVKFIESMQAAMSSGIVTGSTLWIEVGPDPVCLGLARECLEIPLNRQLPSLKRSDSCFKTLSTSLATAYMAGADIKWGHVHKEYQGALKLVGLPRYSFDVKDYWSPYIPSDPVPQSTRVQEVPSIPGFPTAIVQGVEKETIAANETTAVFNSKTSHPRLFEAVQNHRVNGVPVCPASIFCEMACTAAKYIFVRRSPGTAVPAMSVLELNILHPLVVTDVNENQTVQISASSSKEQPSLVTVSFRVKTGLEIHDLGGCRVAFGSTNDWKTEFSKASYFVKARADTLEESARSGYAHRILKTMAYKLFANVVFYGEQYRRMEQVSLSSDSNEAVATVRLTSASSSEDSKFSTLTTDPLVQIAGFVLNGNPSCPDDTVYLSQGFECFRVLGDVSAEKNYQCYTRMQEISKGLYSGDVYVFDKDDLIAVCSGLVFQKMKTTVLSAILRGGAMSKKPTAELSTVVSLQGQGPSQQASLNGNLSKSRASRRRRGSFDTSSSDTASQASTTPSSVNEIDMVEVFASAIASEVGIDRGDIETTTLFEDLGVDSMMSIAILDAVKKATGKEIPANFFQSHSTLAEIEKEFRAPSPDLAPKATEVPPSRDAVKERPRQESSESEKESESEDEYERAAKVSPRDWSILTPDSEFDIIPSGRKSETYSDLPTKTHAPEHAALPARPAMGGKELSGAMKENKTSKTLDSYSSNVVLLQGRPRSDKTPIFLLVDGAGSASAYIHLPIFASGAPVYALESPFIDCPLEYTCSIEEVAQIFFRSLRATQPHGPYILGGWSAGAAYSYEVSRLLLGAGEKILGLILIDMRVPRPMPNVEPTAELIEQAGLVIGIKRAGRSIPKRVAEQLEQHLLSTCRALVAYNPTPMHENFQPGHVVVIWATQGMKEVAGRGDMDDIQDLATSNFMEDSSTGLKPWFFAKRSSFGPNGWDKLIGKELECHTVEADHFSMMVRPEVKNLGHILKQSVEKFLAQS